MKQVTTYTFAVILTAALAGCAGNGSSASSSDNYDQAVADAKASLSAAAKANYEWRDSGKLLKKADAAAKKGDYETAIKLANKAGKQGELALAQSKDQANAGSR